MHLEIDMDVELSPIPMEEDNEEVEVEIDNDDGKDKPLAPPSSLSHVAATQSHFQLLTFFMDGKKSWLWGIV